MKNENYDDNENSMTAEEFLDFMRKNRRTVPNEKRIANKDKFIWAVSELILCFLIVSTNCAILFNEYLYLNL